MARSRIIKPGFFENKKLADCSAHARLLFIGLWQIADCEGRVRYTESGLKGKIFQYEDNLDIGGMLVQLKTGGFLVLYRTESELYLEIVNFKKHQHIHPGEKSNKYPPPNNLQETEQKPDKVRAKTGQSPALSTSTSTSNTTSNSTSTSCEDGKLDKFEKVWKEMELDTHDGQIKYDPESIIDFKSMFTKMRNWVSANKAKKNWKKFIVGWINRDLEKILVNKPKVKDYGQAGLI